MAVDFDITKVAPTENRPSSFSRNFTKALCLMGIISVIEFIGATSCSPRPPGDPPKIDKYIERLRDINREFIRKFPN